MAKKKNPQHRTPRGIAVYPRLDTPDTKFHDAGVYKADIRLTGEAAQTMISQIQAIAMEEMGEELPVSDTIIKKKGKYRPNEDNNCFQPEFDNETGEIIPDSWVFNFRVKNQMVKDRKSGEERLWDRKPTIYTASGKPVNKVKVGGGTEYAVIFEVYCGKVSTGEPFIALQPVAVQVYKLVEFSSADRVDAALLEKEEEGWEPDEDDDMVEKSDDTSDDIDAGTSVEGEEDF